MQNMFQIGFALADLVPGTGQGAGLGTGQGAGQGDGIGPAQVLRGLTDQATAQANGQPFVAKGVEVTGPLDAPEFQAVFETLPTSLVPLDQTNPDDRLGQMGQPMSDPSDQTVTADALFDAFASGDIDIDEFIPPDSPLSDQVKAALAQRASNPTDAVNPAVTLDPMNADDVLTALQTLASTAQSGSAVQAAALRLQSQVEGVQSALTAGTSPLGGVPAGAPASASLAAVTQPGQSTSASGQPAPATPVFDEQSATSQMTTAAERIRSALPEGSLPSQAGAAVAATPQPGLSALARDLEQGRRAEGRLPADERAIPSDMVGRDMPPLRPVTTPLAPPTLPPQLTTLTEQTPLNLAGLDANPLALDGEGPARDARGITTLGATTQQGLPTPMSPAQAQQVTRQIAVAIQNNANRTVELTLSPAELGRVRISLSSADAGMVVSIQADRPETLDLMRRNAELLADDFRDIGYDGATFSFEGSDQQEQAAAMFDDGPDPSDDTLPGLAVSDDGAEPPSLIQTLILGDGAVDIRL